MHVGPTRKPRINCFLETPGRSGTVDVHRVTMHRDKQRCAAFQRQLRSALQGHRRPAFTDQDQHNRVSKRNAKWELAVAPILWSLLLVPALGRAEVAQQSLSGLIEDGTTATEKMSVGLPDGMKFASHGDRALTWHYGPGVLAAAYAAIGSSGMPPHIKADNNSLSLFMPGSGSPIVPCRADKS